jgi:hypothetical protein
MGGVKKPPTAATSGNDGTESALPVIGRESREKMDAVVRAWETQGKERLRMIRWADPRSVPHADEVGSEDSSDDSEDDDEDDESTGSLRDFIVSDEEDEEDEQQESDDVDGIDDDDETIDENMEELVSASIHGDNNCVVCEERPCNACIDPCGHAMFCYACLRALERKATTENQIFACPTCRRTINNVLKIYHR